MIGDFSVASNIAGNVSAGNTVFPRVKRAALYDTL